MSELRRLLDGEGDALELALLRSAGPDAPSRRATERAMAALGIGGAVVAASAAAASAAEAAGSVAAGQVAGAAGQAAVAGAGQAAAVGAGQVAAVGVGQVAAAGAGHAAAAGVAQAVGANAGLVVLAKWAGIAAVGGLATLTAADRVLAPSEPEREPTAVAVASTVSAPLAPRTDGLARGGALWGREQAAEPPEATAAAADASPSAGEPSSAHVADTAPPASERAEGPGGSGSAAAEALRAEVASLDGARSAMQSGRGNDALRALDQHEKDFGAGTLGPEAEVLRIEVLAKMGRMDEARVRAEAFLARHPTSPHAQRVRSLVAGGR